MGKRPLGLGQAAKLKKKKTESQDTNKEVKENTPAEEATPNIEIELPEDTTADEELAEIYGLFNKLHTDDDPQEQLKLARGIVHEADSLLRAREQLPAKGHVVYGAALLAIAAFQNEDSKEKPEDFRKVGLERMDIGLENADTGVKALAALSLIEDADNQMAAASDKKKAVGDVLKSIDKAVSLLAGSDGSQVEALNRLLEFAGSLDTLNHAKAQEFMEFCHPRLTQLAKITTDKTQRLAHKGLGFYELSKSTPVLERIEDEEEPSDDEIDIAAEALSSAVAHFEAALEESDPDSYVRLGETLLNLGNLQENESEQQDATYAKAVKNIKTAKLLGADGLDELIEDLE